MPALGRREFLHITGLLLASGCRPSAEPAIEPVSDLSELRALEQRAGGRIGVAMLALPGDVVASHRAHERFAMCSTFKAPLAAAILARQDEGALLLSDTVHVSRDDLVPYAPLVEKHVGQGPLTIAQLAEAAVQLSDNAAANILLRIVGGPVGLTAFFRRNGDAFSRLDRMEPDLNENAVGDPRDTTIPLAMARLMARLLFSRDIPAGNRLQLQAWMQGTSTGNSRIRASVPQGWLVGNKTGTAPDSAPAYNDIAFLTSPAGRSYVLAILLDRPTLGSSEADAAIAEAAAICVSQL